MGFLRILVDAHFRTDKKGRLLFRLGFGRSRLVPGEDDAAILRRKLVTHYIGLFAGALVIGALQLPLIISTVLFVALSIAIWAPVRAQVQGWEAIGEQLTFKGWISGWTVGRSVPVLRLEFWLSALMTCGTIAVAAYGDAPLLRFGSLVLAVVFGGYAGLCLTTLLRRYRGR